MMVMPVNRKRLHKMKLRGYHRCCRERGGVRAFLCSPLIITSHTKSGMSLCNTRMCVCCVTHREHMSCVASHTHPFFTSHNPPRCQHPKIPSPPHTHTQFCATRLISHPPHHAPPCHRHAAQAPTPNCNATLQHQLQSLGGSDAECAVRPCLARQRGALRRGLLVPARPMLKTRVLA